jgi:hypothetical protein
MNEIYLISLESHFTFIMYKGNFVTGKNIRQIRELSNHLKNDCSEATFKKNLVTY